MAKVDELQLQAPPVSIAALRACRAGARSASGLVLMLALWSLAARSHVAVLDRLSVPSMKRLSAIAFVFLAIALACSSPSARRVPERPGARVIGKIAAALGGLIGVFVVATHSFPFGGYNAQDAFPLSATSIVLLSTALLSLDLRTESGFRPSEYLALGVLFVAFAVFCGYVLGVGAFKTLAGPNDAVAMTFSATVGFLLLAFGIICAMPTARLVTMVTSAFLGGVVARRLLVAVLLLPSISILVMSGQRASLYGSEVSAALLAVVGMFAGVALLYATAKTVDRIDAQRASAMDELLRWKSLFDNASWGALLADAEGRIRLVNPAFAKMHGYADDALVGTKLVDLVAPDRREHYLSFESRVHTQGHARFETNHVHRDGSVFPVLVDATCVRDERGELDYCINYVQDTTEWRAAERHQAMLATVVESSADAIVTLAWPDFGVQTWNPAAEQLFGWKWEDIRGASFERPPWVPSDRLGELSRVRASLRRGERIDALETVCQRKDGTRFHAVITAWPLFDADGHVAMYSMTTRDVSRNKEAEEALRGSEERYRVLFERASDERLRLQAILDQMPDGVIVVDADGKLIATNRAAEALSAVPREVEPSPSEISIDLRRPSGEPLDSDDLPLNRLLRLGATTKSKELVAVLRDGRSIPLLVSAAEVRAPRGALIGAVATFQDITTLKDLERMREEWASVVAHDLRQPLHAIELNAQLLEKYVHGLERADVVRRSVERIEGAVGRLDRMIRDLTDVSRIEARRLTLQPSSLDLCVLADDVIERFGAEASIISVQKVGESHLLLADPDRIDQVLTNLLSNALKYGDSKSPISLVIDYREQFVVVSVRNRGKGIPPDELDRVFSRFERSSVSTGVRGLGLGLYICRGLVEAHGGQIRVESILNGTTTFSFSLPYSIPESRRAFLFASTPTPSPTSG